MNRYNWDNLEVGRLDLNDSENFFAFKHSKHEKFVFDTEVAEVMMDEDEKENRNGVLNSQLIQDPLKCDKVNTSQDIKDEKLSEKDVKPLVNQIIKTEKPLSNLLKEPITSTNIQEQVKQNGPRVFKYVEIYEKKKQDILKKQLADEKKNRVFHSRPAPKFNASQEILSKRSKETKITLPVTPQVVKHSEKARIKLADLKKKSPPRYHAREAKVLTENPFVPKKCNHVLQMQPFHLNIEKRLIQRKNFDEKFQKQMEEKKKREEEIRLRREEELSKELRKLTTFKARPNPFK